MPIRLIRFVDNKASMTDFGRRRVAVAALNALSVDAASG